MSKSRRKPSRRREDAENDRTLRELTLFVQEAGFHLGLAYVDTAKTRQTQLKRLADAVADRPVYLTTLNLAKFPVEEQLLDRLREHLRDNPAPEGKTPAVMVVGLESLLDYEDVGPLKRKPQTIFRNANIQRDAYARLCPVPIVLWLFPVASTLFANEAPDLWHWRSGSFYFTGLPEERRVVEMSLLESDRLPKADKMDRISLLSELLGQMDLAADRETKGNKARRANLLHEIALAYDALSDPVKAIRYAGRALDLFREAADRVGEGSVLGNMGVFYAANGDGDMEKAIRCYDQSLSIARELGNRRSEAGLLGNLGNVYASLDMTEKAIECLDQSLSVVRELGDRHIEGSVLGNLGRAYAVFGDSEKAIRCFEQSLTTLREIGDRIGEARMLYNLGNVSAALGELEKAVGYYERSLSVARKLGDSRAEGPILYNLGSTFVRLGDIEPAIRYYEESRLIAQKIGDRSGEGRTLSNLGGLYLDFGETQKATEMLDEALRIGQAIGDPQIITTATANRKRVDTANID